VINNIIINSIQAMPHGGTITIEALNINTGKDRAIIAQHSFVIEPGDYVMISIEDQGIGIAPEYISRIFDPYFSLKENGTGLGLATSYSIIKRHNGYIDAKSEVGVGTTIFIYLPAAKSEMPIEVEPEPAESPVRGSGRVLLMDDDETILAVCGELIRKMGYDTVLARDGRETLRIFEESLRNSEKIDAVIMDLVIPGGMGGKECIRELLKIDPSARVIVSSGYFERPDRRRLRKFGSGVIAKPTRRGPEQGAAYHHQPPDLPRS
jgi:CheY-like chemotaxis protein